MSCVRKRRHARRATQSRSNPVFRESQDAISWELWSPVESGEIGRESEYTYLFNLGFDRWIKRIEQILFPHQIETVDRGELRETQPAQKRPMHRFGKPVEKWKAGVVFHRKVPVRDRNESASAHAG